MTDEILEKAKKWAKDFGCEVLYYAGEEDGYTYFNGRSLDMSGYAGIGSSFCVTPSGEIVLFRDDRRIAISDKADELSLFYYL